MVGNKVCKNEIQAIDKLHYKQLEYTELKTPRSLAHLKAERVKHLHQMTPQEWSEKRDDIINLINYQIIDLILTIKKIKALIENITWDVDPEVIRSHNIVLSYIDDEITQLEEEWPSLRRKLETHKKY